MEESVPIGRATYHIKALDKEGRVLWEEDISNLVVTVGKNDVLDKYFKGSSYTAAWYIGLKGSGTAAASDTMSSHPSWSEVTGYSQSTRPTLTLGTPSGGSVNNSASPATFSINSTVTIAGVFLANNSTKGGTSGTLYSVADFSSARTLANGDSLQVTVTLTVS